MEFDIRKTQPSVSVVVITYNHEPYIRQCLDSLLMQRTDFPYEICLGEDASTDGTREICIAYAERHPDKIRLLLQSRSDPARQRFLAPGNFNYWKTLSACCGKYLADCDGDDAWTDPLKLQKQHDLLEADPSICLVHSDYDRFDERSGRILQAVNRSRGVRPSATEKKRELVSAILGDRYHIRTCTVMTRASAVAAAMPHFLPLLERLPMGDVPLWCELAMQGGFAYVDEPLALYRCLEESACNSNDHVRKSWFVNRAADLHLLLLPRHGLPARPQWAHKIKSCMRHAIASGDFAEIDRLHRESNAFFPTLERGIYFACKWRRCRRLLQNLYARKYARHLRLVGHA